MKRRRVLITRTTFTVPSIPPSGGSGHDCTHTHTHTHARTHTFTVPSIFPSGGGGHDCRKHERARTNKDAHAHAHARAHTP